MQISRLTDPPLFRSANQAKLLWRLVRARPGWRTLSELAAEISVSPSTVQREIERLEPAGLVESRRSGNNRDVRIDDRSRFYPEIDGLLTKMFGPEALLSQALSQAGGIDEAYIFGSWAAGQLGTSPPEAPRDLDVLIVGDPDVDAVYSICREVERKIGLEVSPVVITTEEWAAAETSGGAAFLRAVRGGPRISLLSADD